MAVLNIEGQTHTIPDELAKSGTTVEAQDNNLREALRPHFDLAANATFQRTEKDGALTITVLKAPGRKGTTNTGLYARVVQRLKAAPSELTEVMVVETELRLLEARGRLDVDALICYRPRIAKALQKSTQDIQRMEQARQILVRAPAVVDGTNVPLAV